MPGTSAARGEQSVPYGEDASNPGESGKRVRGQQQRLAKGLVPGCARRAAIQGVHPAARQESDPL